MRDFKEELVAKRLSSLRAVIGVASGKGGVGKTLVSTTLALLGARKGLLVSLFDADFTNPCCHLVLGVDLEKVAPREERGVIPPIVEGVSFVTVAYYSGDRALPLRGGEEEKAFKEILAVTLWPEGSYLLIDLPPGFGDQLLNVLTYVGARILAVTTPDPLGLRSLRRLLDLVGDAVLGVVENMSRGPPRARDICKEYGVPYLARVPYVEGLDGAIGRPDLLLASPFSEELKGVWERLERCGR